MTRLAACNCGQLTVACAGEPVRVSICRHPWAFAAGDLPMEHHE
ncbi:hypothetical protein [Sphingomonas montanisoli]|nr:hypothetical protein [Sphingomonas montanisoli]